ncbi:MAG: zinc ribbon domain-containing protein [Magnetococcales bacterium]|nr:zinc ribbon domain-containing protein [Magnetococcales bacterium]
MPLYDYKCDACHGRFEIDHPMAGPIVTRCPGCGEEKLRKILSTGGLLGSTKLGQQDSRPAMPPMGGCPSGGCGGGMCGL